MSAYEVVVVGASWGGLVALQSLLRGLPADFETPIVIAQHRTSDNDSRLTELLDKYSSVRVCEVQDRQDLRGHRIYLAPPDYHVIAEPGALALSTEGPVNFARPSIDVLFESAAHVFGPAVVAVVLTGASTDGAEGARAVVAGGGRLLVQSPSTAEREDAPRAALAAARADLVGSISAIGAWLSAHARAWRAHKRPEEHVSEHGST